jgi:hypothetical protein
MKKIEYRKGKRGKIEKGETTKKKKNSNIEREKGKKSKKGKNRI